MPTDWKTRYGDMVLTPAEAVAQIRPGQRVFLGTGGAQPQALIDALLTQAAGLQDIDVFHLLSLADPAYRHAELAQQFQMQRFFIDGDEEDTVGPPGDFIPVFHSDIPRLFDRGQFPIDVALIQVTPPNEHGYCSLGISVDICKNAAENAGLVIAQVNTHMPWTTGDTLLHLHDLDYLVVEDRPLLEYNPPPITETTEQIAEHVAPLVPDGATLEIGTRAIPQAVMQRLHHKQDLGVHTEVLSDALLDLIVSGAVTGVNKSVDRTKVVATLCRGTQRLYDFVNHNPTICLRPADEVCDPHVISHQRHMVAITVGVEVDLSGQVCASSPTSGFSGMGSRADFIQGAARAPGGRVIVTLEATRQRGRHSRIVPHLSAGAQVAAKSTEVHYVVTEFGVAYLRGQSLADRALALISVAHPHFRAELLRAAVESGTLRSGLAAVEGKIHVLPPEVKTAMLLADGTQIHIRTLQPTDEKPMRGLFNALSKETLYYRFMSRTPRVPRKQIQEFVYIDYREEMALVATLPEAHGEDIIAVGRYYRIPNTNTAEVAFIVRDQWQGKGIGSFLLTTLKTLAQNNGITAFSAEVLANNMAMLAVFQKSGCRVSSHIEGSVQSLELQFE